MLGPRIIAESQPTPQFTREHNVSEAESKRDFKPAQHSYKYTRTRNKVLIVMTSPGVGERKVFEHDRVGGFIAAMRWAKRRGVTLER